MSTSRTIEIRSASSESVNNSEILQPLFLRGCVVPNQDTEPSFMPDAPMRTSRMRWIEGLVRSSSSSSQSEDNDDLNDLPKEFRCSRRCCGHPVISYPKQKENEFAHQNRASSVNSSSQKETR